MFQQQITKLGTLTYRCQKSTAAPAVPSTSSQLRRRQLLGGNSGAGLSTSEHSKDNLCQLFAGPPGVRVHFPSIFPQEAIVIRTLQRLFKKMLGKF